MCVEHEDHDDGLLLKVVRRSRSQLLAGSVNVNQFIETQTFARRSSFRAVCEEEDEFLGSSEVRRESLSCLSLGCCGNSYDGYHLGMRLIHCLEHGWGLSCGAGFIQ